MDSVRQLSFLRTVQRKPVNLQNSFQSLEAKETESTGQSIADPASLMGTQEIREKTGVSKSVGEPASLMGTQGTRERTEVGPPPRPFTLDGVGMMRMAQNPRRLGPLCAQKKGICDCGIHTPTPTRTSIPTQVSQSCAGPNFDKRDDKHYATTDERRMPSLGNSASLMGTQCDQGVTGKGKHPDPTALRYARADTESRHPVVNPASLMGTQGQPRQEPQEVVKTTTDTASGKQNAQ